MRGRRSGRAPRGEATRPECEDRDCGSRNLPRVEGGIVVGNARSPVKIPTQDRVSQKDLFDGSSTSPCWRSRRSFLPQGPFLFFLSSMCSRSLRVVGWSFPAVCVLERSPAENG